MCANPQVVPITIDVCILTLWLYFWMVSQVTQGNCASLLRPFRSRSSLFLPPFVFFISWHYNILSFTPALWMLLLVKDEWLRLFCLFFQPSHLLISSRFSMKILSLTDGEYALGGSGDTSACAQAVIDTPDTPSAGSDW